MSSGTIKFAGVTMQDSRVFYNRNHVFAMVLHNQICEGHILLAPKMPDKNYRDLTNPQLFEIILAIKELSQLVEKTYESSTNENKVVGISVVIQEFEAHKLSMNHLRVHIIPRRQNDSPPRTDEMIKAELENFAQTFTEGLKNQEQYEAKLSEEAQRYKNALNVAQLGRR